MEWVSFMTGVVVAGFALALFTSDKDQLEPDPEELEEGITVNDFTGRHVTMSCQTCRKLKKHREVEPNLYQCTKCKRHVDLRAS